MKFAWSNALLVGAGGFIGAVLRYALGGLVHRQLPLTAFPWGTLTVNVLGCFLIGALGGVGESRQLLGPELRAFAIMGLLGGFTTFSAFGHETFAMLREGDVVRAAANVSLQVIVGLAAVWLGYALMHSR